MHDIAAQVNVKKVWGQLRECKAFAGRKGITLVGSYIDRAISGREAENRLEFQRLIKDSSKHIFDVIIVWKLDRFARNRYDSAHHQGRETIPTFSPAK